MPRLSSWFVRSSLLYLALGFTLGAVLLANKGLDLNPSIWQLLPIHIEILLVGWFVQLAMGVAFWILPRLSGPYPRGNQALAWSAFWLINLGMALAVLHAATSVSGLLLAGRLAEFCGVSAFITSTWRRVKPFNT